VAEAPTHIPPAPPAWPIELPGLQVRDLALPVSVLRLWRAEAGHCDALSQAFALPWPRQPNTVAGDAPRVLWLAPSEWAILDAPAEVVVARVAQACGTGLWHCVDLTESRVAFEVRGARGLDLLAKGCSLDLHPRAFAPGACAQTLPVDKIKLPPGFHIEVWTRLDNARGMTLGADFHYPLMGTDNLAEWGLGVHMGWGK